VSVLTAGSTYDELSRFKDAEYNIVVHEECGNNIVKWLKQEYGMPYLIPSEGAPIGFYALGSFINEISVLLSTNPEPGLQKIKKAKEKFYLHLSRVNSLTGLPRGTSFAVNAEPSIAYALTKWLYEYLGMCPVSVKVPCSKQIN